MSHCLRRILNTDHQKQEGINPLNENYDLIFSHGPNFTQVGIYASLRQVTFLKMMTANTVRAFHVDTQIGELMETIEFLLGRSRSKRVLALKALLSQRWSMCCFFPALLLRFQPYSSGGDRPSYSAISVCLHFISSY